MTSGMTALAIAVGGTSLICFVVTTQLQNRRPPHRSSSDSSGADGAGYAGDHGGTLGWSDGVRSASDSSGNPVDGGGDGSDSGGGGDGGGGDGGGGGD
jgi:hypothetical protein